MDAPKHEPVMPAEVISMLMPSRGGQFVDCTVGLGGHSALILESGADALIGLDRDEDALRIAAERLAAFGDRVELVHSDYRQLGGRAREPVAPGRRWRAGGSRRLLDAARGATAVASASAVTSRSTCAWTDRRDRPWPTC